MLCTNEIFLTDFSYRQDVNLYLTTFLLLVMCKALRIHKKGYHSFGIVTFTQADSAAKALDIKYHNIAGDLASVTIAHSWHQNCSFLDLIDDYLSEISSYLSVWDLCATAETNIRLNKIAKEF